jgi:predicted alpha/beta hydrolase family esterase
MPKEDDPNYELYKTQIEKELNRIEDKVILVGHSLGACFLLKYLAEEKVNKHIAGMFLIATPFWGKGGWQYEGFTLNNMLASKRTTNIPVFFYHSTGDEIVPFAHLSLYKEKFPHAVIRKIIGRGHQLKNDVTEIVQDIKSLYSID